MAEVPNRLGQMARLPSLRDSSKTDYEAAVIE